ncbi:MAG: acetylxylan esterase [Leptospiraceae bacterium]|nr:acetylxylan esterase [Leptospiraceae bacterium]MDW7975631.1 acetylxylan esterase [Leptospiraceae bacterium]
MAKKFPSFDECYHAKPVIEMPENFDTFWEEEILKLKKRPLEPIQKLRLKTNIAKESFYDIQFRGHLDNYIQGYLILPRKLKKVPLIITLHDYWKEFTLLNEMNQMISSQNIAHLHLYLQPQEILQQIHEEEKDDPKKEFLFPTLFLDAYKQSTSHDYGVFLVLDVLRSIDFIRLNKNIEHTKVGILGRGLGANLAIFAAALRPESIKVLALERPSLVWMEYFIKYSHSQLSKEYQKILQSKKQKVKKIIDSHSIYNDALLVANKIKVPTLISVGMEDEEHPSYCAFGFFNSIQTDKYMQVFTDEKQDPDQRKERTKSLEFLIERLNNY